MGSRPSFTEVLLFVLVAIGLLVAIPDLHRRLDAQQAEIDRLRGEVTQLMSFIDIEHECPGPAI